MLKTIQIKTQYGIYPIRVELDEKGLIATALTLPGIITWAKNVAQLKRCAQEALELGVESLAESALTRRLESVEYRLNKITEKVTV